VSRTLLNQKDFWRHPHFFSVCASKTFDIKAYTKLNFVVYYNF
jgi:hypothetical protein